MNKCLNCQVTFTDSTNICPLCKCIMESNGKNDFTPAYPFAEKGVKKMKAALNIYSFSAIVAEAILLGINYAFTHNIWWAILIGAFFVYGFVTLKFSIQKHISYQFKMLLQTLLAVSLLVLIDVVSGFGGWSICYVIPAVFILLDLTIIILMIVNRRNWQSYISLQLLIIALSVIPFVLHCWGFNQNLVMSTTSLTVALCVFGGTLIVGGKRARAELYRRFHV